MKLGYVYFQLNTLLPPNKIRVVSMEEKENRYRAGNWESQPHALPGRTDTSTTHHAFLYFTLFRLYCNVCICLIILIT